MKHMVDSGAAIHVFPGWHGFSPLSLSTRRLSLNSAGGDVLHHLGSKTESYVYRNLKFQVNCEVAPVVRPILSVGMLTRKGVLVVFGAQGRFIHPKGAIVLNGTLVDGQNMKFGLVSPVAPSAVSVPSEAGDKEMRDSRYVSEWEATQIPVMGGAREMNRSKQRTESEGRSHELSHLPHVPRCTICCRARTVDEAHHVVIREESVDSLPKIVCVCVEIKMKGNTAVLILLVVDSSTGHLGATDVDQKSGGSGFAAKWMAKWLEATGYARMKVHSDAEQSIEHLLKAVKSICTADLIVQRHHSRVINRKVMSKD